jgi:hypothetical protein
MSESEFPPSLLELLQRCASTLPAVELLLLLAERPEATWSLDELVESFRKREFSPPFIAENLAKYQRSGLVEEQEGGRFRYCPASTDLADTVKLLRTAYNERPVTLIRAIYSVADHPIQSFSDSFRIKSDSP